MAFLWAFLNNFEILVGFFPTVLMKRNGLKLLLRIKGLWIKLELLILDIIGFISYMHGFHWRDINVTDAQ